MRERRYRKKFDAGKEHIPTLFRGLTVPREIEQIALFVYGSNRTHKTVGGGTVLTIRTLLGEIFESLRSQGLSTRAIPEHMPILRSFQFVAEYRSEIIKALGKRDA